jgi:photosystem II stability/assembly factor-like uncharacterized protein
VWSGLKKLLTFIIPIAFTLTGCSTWRLQSHLPNVTQAETNSKPVNNIGSYLQFAMTSNAVGWSIKDDNNGYSSVLRTSDGGVHWRNVSPAVKTQPIMASDFMTDNVAWVVSSIGDAPAGHTINSPVLVYFTSDGGRNWHEGSVPGTSMQSDTPITIKFLNSNDGWLLLGDNGREHISLYKTVDGGSHWSLVPQNSTHSLPMTNMKTGMTFVTKNKGFVSGLGASSGLYETLDGGSTWSGVPVPLESNLSFDFARPPVFFNERDGILEVQYLPFDNGKIAASQFLQTNDGGKTWSALTDKLYSIQSGGGTGDILSKNNLFLAAAGTVYMFDAGQTSWTQLPVHFSETPNYVDFVSPQVGWAFNMSGTMYSTDDGGLHWTRMNPTLTN